MLAKDNEKLYSLVSYLGFCNFLNTRPCTFILFTSILERPASIKGGGGGEERGSYAISK